jgi:hypothetical protein
LGENGDALPKIGIMKSYMKSMESEDKNQALIHAYTYWAPVLYFLGLAGSIASLVTLQSSKFSARIYVYLRALALSDLFFLSFAISNCTRTFHDEIRDTPNKYDESEHSVAFYHLSEIPIINGFLSTSVFIVVCMTMDRYIKKLCKCNNFSADASTLLYPPTPL